MKVLQKIAKIGREVEKEERKIGKSGLSRKEIVFINAARNLIVKAKSPEERIFIALACLHKFLKKRYKAIIDFYQKINNTLLCVAIVGAKSEIIDRFYKDVVNPNSRLNEFEKSGKLMMQINDPEKDRPIFTWKTGIKKSIYFRANGHGILGVHLKENIVLSKKELEFIKEYVRNNLNLSIKNSLDRVTDGLTGLYTREHLLKEILPREFELHKRQNKEELTLVFIDVDHFKKYNDTYGHLQGDKAIKEIAHAIMRSIRKTDIAVRYAGDEFVVLLPRTKRDFAIKIAERIRRAIEGLIILTEKGIKTSLSASIGVAFLNKKIKTIEQLIELADSAAYKAKKKGKNRVEIV